MFYADPAGRATGTAKSRGSPSPGGWLFPDFSKLLRELGQRLVEIGH
jgi:hypothetical protein